MSLSKTLCPLFNTSSIQEDRKSFQHNLIFVPVLLEEKQRDLVFASLSFHPSVRPSFRPPIEVGTLWVQLLQLYTDSFETSLVFWSWS